MTADGTFSGQGNVIHAAKLLALLFCLYLIAGGCAGSSSGLTQQDVGSIEGRILQDPDGIPLENATIHVYSPDPQVTQRGFSDANGYYHIANLPTGSYELTISCPSHESANYDNVRVTAYAVTRLPTTRLKSTDGEHALAGSAGLDPVAGVFFAIGGSLVVTEVALGDEIDQDVQERFYWAGGVSVAIGILIQIEQQGKRSRHQAMESMPHGNGVGLAFAPNGSFNLSWRTRF